MGEVTHVWLKGMPPPADLSEDLATEQAFSDYWRLVHGYRLPAAALGGFARVVFPKAGFELTYPLACLWRQPWVQRPMLTAKVAPQIVKAALESLQELDLFGRTRCAELGPGPLASALAAALPPPVLPRPLPAPVLPLLAACGEGRSGLGPGAHGHGPAPLVPSRAVGWRAEPQQQDRGAEGEAPLLPMLGAAAAAAPRGASEGSGAPGELGAAPPALWEEAAREAQRRGKRLLLAPPQGAPTLPGGGRAVRPRLPRS